MPADVRALQRFLVNEDEPADPGPGQRQRDGRADRAATEYGDGGTAKLWNACVVLPTVNPCGIDALDRVSIRGRAAKQARVQHAFRNGPRAKACDERIPSAQHRRTIDDRGRKGGSIFSVSAENDEHARSGFTREIVEEMGGPGTCSHGIHVFG
jgi:hypothetical protein